MRSDRIAAGPSSGITLLETLIVLAILAAVAAVALPSMRGPSPKLVLRSMSAELSARISAARLAAISSGQSREMNLADLTCDDAQTPAAIVFQADGLVLGPDLCLSHATESLRVKPSILTGQLVGKTLP